MRSHQSMAELRWRGLESVPEITSTLLKHEAATLHLPASYHHALCVRLCTDDSAPGVIDTTGDASLLHKAASIQGLGDLASLCESLTRAGALVRICSPAPRIYFMRPQTKMRRTLRGRVVGMVTLDDLLLDEAAAIDDLAAIVQGQIGEGGPAESDRTPRRKRSAGRATATLGRLVGQARSRTEFKDGKEAEAALRLVLENLVRRLTANEAKDLVAQLPSLLQPSLRKLASGPDKGISRVTIEAELVERLGMDAARAANALAAIGATVADRVSSGQMDDVRVQLPADLRAVFS